VTLDGKVVEGWNGGRRTLLKVTNGDELYLCGYAIKRGARYPLVVRERS
jgi:hypothetical protein